MGAFMLDVLKRYGTITLLTLERFEPEWIDEYYGTSLTTADIQPIVVKDPLLDLFTGLGLPNGLLKLHALMKAAKTYLREGPDFDLVCAGYDEQDLGTPCIQYIHYPWNLYPRPDAPPGWEQSSLLQRVILLYNFVCRKFSGFSPERVCQNLTLVNSRWTGEKARECYPNLDYLVLNPPALAQPLTDNGSRRQERFLSIGRCAPEKRWLTLIDIVKGLRERGHDVGLTLAGSRSCPSYERSVEERANEEGEWITLTLDFSREELQALLMTHRYGLHGMVDEHYGMAVAELILGGCLTMVPNDGGQVEIVTNEALRYSSVSEAVEKLHCVLTCEATRERLLREQLSGRAHLRAERFAEEFERVVECALERGVTGTLRGLQEGTLEGFGHFSLSR